MALTEASIQREEDPIKRVPTKSTHQEVLTITRALGKIAPLEVATYVEYSRLYPIYMARMMLPSQTARVRQKCSQIPFSCVPRRSALGPSVGLASYPTPHQFPAIRALFMCSLFIQITPITTKLFIFY